MQILLCELHTGQQYHEPFNAQGTFNEAESLLQEAPTKVAMWEL